MSLITFNSQDRILILAPHPDDEVLGTGGIIQEAVRLNLPLRIAFLTYGDSNEWSFLLYRRHPVLPRGARKMGLVRHDEAIEAARTLGVTAQQLTFLGYPDFGTLDIWCCHWGDRQPAESILTRSKSVPYPNAFRPGAPYKGEEILADLERVLLEFKPTRIFVSHPGDHNPDHKALYLFLRIALWDREGELSSAVHPCLVHHRHWPEPRGFRPGDRLIPPREFESQIEWQNFDLDPGEVERKHDALKMHRSQYRASRKYLLSFVRSNELFGDFPETALPLGREEWLVRLIEGRIVISIRTPRPLGKEVGASVYIFGYRKDVPFQEMPKLHIKLGEFEHKVFDQDRALEAGAIDVQRRAQGLALEVPLKLLGDPERILTSAHTYFLNIVPLEGGSWRVLGIT